MLAEYFAGFPTAMVCTIAVCTGNGARAASASCLHALTQRTQTIATAAMAYLQQAAEITRSLLSQSFLEIRLRAPEGQKTLLILVICVGDSSFLFEHVAQQHGGFLELLVHLAQLFAGSVARCFGNVQKCAALGQLAKTVVDVDKHLGACF